MMESREFDRTLKAAGVEVSARVGINKMPVPVPADTGLHERGGFSSGPGRGERL